MWDEKVRAITGGLTVMMPARGQWVAPCGKLYSERMIPVRVACKEREMHAIARMTMAYYMQLAVLYYRVSDKVFLLERKEKTAAGRQDEEPSQLADTPAGGRPELPLLPPARAVQQRDG